MATLEDFRSEVERLLDRAEGHFVLQENGRLREAIDNRHGDWLAIVGGLPIQGLAAEFVDLLARADRALSLGEVRELEKVIRKRLPYFPPRK
ncbi:MAG TPA: hypothetical protein VH650_13030 [Gaiellaceae bacterium]|jgi:hypothetical protein